jgi:dTDP-glucose 4,6-dehydratase
MRILLTGSAGFIGSHVAKFFCKAGHEVIGIERLSFSGDQKRLLDVTNYTSIHHNLRDRIPPILKDRIGKVDWVIHVAASSHVDRSIADPMSFVLDNVVATCNILEYAREVRPKKFIYFSTDEVFGPCSEEPYKEDARYNSTNPYSATKAGGEELAVAYRNTFKLPIVVTHTMNVFGNSQHPEKFIPMCIQKIINGDTIEIHSDSSKTVSGSRFYIHVDDVCEALDFILKIQDDEEKLCPKYNIVGPAEITNFNLANKIATLLNKNLNYTFVDFHTSRPGHDLRYALDGSKLKTLGWEPRSSMDDRLKDVIDHLLTSNGGIGHICNISQETLSGDV